MKPDSSLTDSWQAVQQKGARLCVEKTGLPGQLCKLVSGRPVFFHIYSRFSFFVIK